MKTFAIGEILLAFNNPEYIAYCFQGDCKGKLILLDRDNNDTIYWIKSNGDSGYDFYFRMADKEKDGDAKQWVFFHELDKEEDSDLMLEIIKTYTDWYGKLLLKELEETEEETEEEW